MAETKVHWPIIFLTATIVILSVVAVSLLLHKSNSLPGYLQGNRSSPGGVANSAIAFSTSERVDRLGPVMIGGVGVMGDSNSDEYRADDNRGGKYAATTLNWVEQLAKSRGLNFGRWGTWGEPRRTGFEYNWARSGARAQSLIDSGQHTGLAQQVAEGKVSHAILFIGANDFHLANGTYKEIYNGKLAGVALQDKVNAIIRNITLATDTVLAAGPVKMVVVNLGDPGNTPIALQQYPDSQKRQRVTDAIAATNQGIAQMAQARGVPVVDLATFAERLFSNVDQNGYLHVGDALITLMELGDEPHHLQLDDYSGHGGTVCSGLMANSLFVEPFNLHYSTGIVPLSDEEILENAGIKPRSAGQSKIVYIPLLTRFD